MRTAVFVLKIIAAPMPCIILTAVIINAETEKNAAADPLLAGFAEGANMYFTHSYAVADDVDAADVLARTHYTRSFPCIVRHGNVWGCQFHPEKSSALGQRILKNFVSIVEEVGR